MLHLYCPLVIVVLYFLKLPFVSTLLPHFFHTSSTLSKTYFVSLYLEKGT